MSFISNSFIDKTGRRSSLKETRQLVAAVKRTIITSNSDCDDADDDHRYLGAATTIIPNIEALRSPNRNHPPIYSNIKTQGRVMIYDEETFAFKMVHDDQLAAPDSPTNSITNYQGSKTLHLNEDSFDFKLAKLSF
mmetsp:Transcript_12653/g.30215  ORF Transcript_12653/g.30215 Transcript_12653/m.30215 type:complete len:136 (-) Transcript_12653:192-599(-)|eukprot:CAMPEP_0113626364 /NCGR_PEP_ID=MMETSP0017_2-20120614/13633_1 /TAXON_ID=2856 /ORGANISM="Cylindrotheca closterium" /LENGTH=135 /DNA_ID=CAMNT_0000536539 /DNA_START=92 /DNA_END=499 /DNA_ORIENTATION=- /assembly_acc=CAM_ASM_000147